MQDISYAMQGEDSIICRIARIFMRIASVVSFVCEMAARFMGVSCTFLLTVKMIDVVIRICNCFLHVVLEGMRFFHESSLLQYLERAIVLPVISLLRAQNEMGIYRDLSFLELPPERQAQLTHLVEVGEPPFASHLERRPFSVREIEALLVAHEAVAPTLAIIEVGVYLGIVSRFLQGLHSLFKWLEHIYHRICHYDTLERELARAHAIIEDPLNLLRLPVIPQELHADPVLSQHTCPITLYPIRDPVGDPNGITIYERTAILEAIRQQGRSPITRAPLGIHQLREQPELKNSIDRRLQWYSERLHRLLPLASSET